MLLSPSLVHILAKPSYDPVARSVPSLWNTKCKHYSITTCSKNLYSSNGACSLWFRDKQSVNYTHPPLKAFVFHELFFLLGSVILVSQARKIICLKDC